MARKTVAEQIAEEERRLAKSRVRLQRLKAKQQQQERKRDTRRKILLGAFLQKQLEDPRINAPAVGIDQRGQQRAGQQQTDVDQPAARRRAPRLIASYQAQATLDQ